MPFPDRYHHKAQNGMPSHYKSAGSLGSGNCPHAGCHLDKHHDSPLAVPFPTHRRSAIQIRSATLCASATQGVPPLYAAPYGGCFSFHHRELFYWATQEDQNGRSAPWSSYSAILSCHAPLGTAYLAEFCLVLRA